jgi:hypothetical protein
MGEKEVGRRIFANNRTAPAKHFCTDRAIPKCGLTSYLAIQALPPEVGSQGDTQRSKEAVVTNYKRSGSPLAFQTFYKSELIGSAMEVSEASLIQTTDILPVINLGFTHQNAINDLLARPSIWPVQGKNY